MVEVLHTKRNKSDKASVPAARRRKTAERARHATAPVPKKPKSTSTKAIAKGKIIFLDVDGVLNNLPEDRHGKLKDKVEYEKTFGLNSDIIAIFKTLLDRTGAKIVVSSTWRHFEDYAPFSSSDKWREVLASRLGRKADELFIGNTPIMTTARMVLHGISEYTIRGNEIKAWMDENEDKYGKPGESYNFCIIDDSVESILSVFDSRYVVHTDPNKGFTKEDAERAFHILNYA